MVGVVTDGGLVTEGLCCRVGRHEKCINSLTMSNSRAATTIEYCVTATLLRINYEDSHRPGFTKNGHSSQTFDIVRHGGLVSYADSGAVARHPSSIVICPTNINQI